MKYIIYISTAYRLMNHDELLDILAVSRKNNQKHNITGMLLYGEGVFIQLLEGDAEDVKKTYVNISQDLRHKNIIKMAEGETGERNFPEWSMGFKAANSEELTELGGYIDPGKLGFLNAENANSVITIMKTFADMNRMTDNY